MQKTRKIYLKVNRNIQNTKTVETNLTFILMSISFDREMCEVQYLMRLYLYTGNGEKEFNLNVNLTIVKKARWSEISHNFVFFRDII